MPLPLQNPFLRLKAISLLLWSLVILICVVMGLGLVTAVTGWIPDDAVVVPTLYILVFGSLSWCVVGQLKRLGIRLPYVLGRLPDRPRWPRTAGLVIALLLFSLGAFQLSFYALSFAVPSFVEGLLHAIAAESNPKTAIPLLYAVLNGVAVIIIAPIAEEFIFRGVLFQCWAAQWGVRPALLASSLVFGVLHSNLVGLSMFGLVMGLLYIKTRTLIVPMVCHALNNALATAMGFIPTGSSPDASFSSLDQFRSDWWIGLVLLALSLPWLVQFIRYNLPAKDAAIPYLVNALVNERAR